MTKRQLIYDKYNGHCAYCGKEIKIKDMQVDHLEAKSNTIDPDRYENLMPSCRRCNHYKRANKLETFRAMIETIHERIRNFYICKVAGDYGILEYKEWDGRFYFEK